MTKIFLDANIFIDVTDSSRRYSKYSMQFMDKMFDNMDKYELYTSCDLITTIYYIVKKQLDNSAALQQVKMINKYIHVIEFGNDEIEEAIYLMEKNEKFSDLEDTIQYVMARKERCDYIITNDHGFVSHDIPLLSSREALDELGSE